MPGLINAHTHITLWRSFGDITLARDVATGDHAGRAQFPELPAQGRDHRAGHGGTRTMSTTR